MPIDCASTPLVLAAKSPSPSAARGLSQPCADFCPWPSCAASARPAPPAFPGASSAGFSLFLSACVLRARLSARPAGWRAAVAHRPAGAPAAAAVYPDAASGYRLPRGFAISKR